MPAKITFLIATKQGPIVKTGYAANFKIADKVVKFVIQDVTDESVQLTHFASGYTAITDNSINARKLSLYVSNPYASKLSNREICEALLNEIIAKIGAEKLLAKFESVPVINK
jgi:hypothetical protein